jgi:hypothetical protein
MVTIIDMVSGKILSQTGERTADSTQKRGWPADVALPTPRTQPVPVTVPAESNKMPPDLASIPEEILLEE